MRNWVLGLLRMHCSDKRAPDVIIGGADDPYLMRWHVIPRNPFLNIYFHHFLRSDDDSALHDHPWWNVSWLLDGEYLEHTRRGCKEVREGACKFRFAKSSHRIQLFQRPSGKELPVWTLFITGPKFREWGFHCAGGWRRWNTSGSVDTDQNGTTLSNIKRACD